MTDLSGVILFKISDYIIYVLRVGLSGFKLRDLPVNAHHSDYH